MPDIYPALAVVGVLALGIAFAVANGIVGSRDENTQEEQRGNPNP